MYRGLLPGRLRVAGPSRSGGDVSRDQGGVRRRPRPPPSNGVLHLAAPALRARDAQLHASATTTRPSTWPGPPGPGGGPPPSWVAFASSTAPSRPNFNDYRLRQIFSFQSMYAGLSPYEALAIYCVIHLHGCGRRGLLPRRRHPCPCPPRGWPQPFSAARRDDRYTTPRSERILRRPAAVAASSPACASRAATPSTPTLSSSTRPARTGLPPLPSRAAAASGLARGRVPGHYSPSCVVWLVGTRGRLPNGAAHHNIHFGQDWKGGFHGADGPGDAHADPSILVSRRRQCPTRPSLRSGHNSL